jgi:hypothetical protein
VRADVRCRGRYGWQRDELYFAVAGRHLQGGYVEFPPVTALLAALARVLFGVGDEVHARRRPRVSNRDVPRLAPVYVRQVERLAGGADVIVAANYGEAGALELFGRGLPPVASVDVTMRYWRPAVTGRRALLVGYSRTAADSCTSFRRVARVSTPRGSNERGEPIARCTLDGTLAHVRPQIIATSETPATEQR